MTGKEAASECADRVVRRVPMLEKVVSANALGGKHKRFLQSSRDMVDSGELRGARSSAQTRGDARGR